MVKRVLSGFAYNAAPGVPRVLGAGALVADDDPAVAGREQLFEDVDDYVENATAAPGQRRMGTPGRLQARHVGRGVYELPDGSRVTGKDEAARRLDAMEVPA